MRAVRWVVLVVLVVIAASCAAPPPPPATGPELRVMTFNIHHGEGPDGIVSLDRIAATIRAADADVIGLQEVDRHFAERSSFVDQATYLAEALEMDLVFGANIDLDPLVVGQPRRQYGTAILSRLPLTASGNTLLPRAPTSEQRGLLHASVTVEGTDVTVFVTHLQHDSPTERLAQVNAITAELDATGGNVVLLGDLNAEPGSPEIEHLVDTLSDAWTTGGFGPGYTFSSVLPFKRIDYVMSSDGLVARTAAVLTSDGSDHLPVVADVALPQPLPV
ncbi:endonuclease/exonuclease/phosphatase family protein [Dermatobacter hominis]|uniref:endonuclease/exonuclease/phosphatase family protein n=1 Tax=Dermatobacter hominis TaxID=2884263 RepID=UPI001D12E7FF|nr:endonuclease/exonuclease/phosphatase family protein [Dermatobacter hominis]UDY34517.1 endonuclease/exonuclease/phosphatase family protein [Dermatobacter hominis]